MEILIHQQVVQAASVFGLIYRLEGPSVATATVLKESIFQIQISLPSEAQKLLTVEGGGFRSLKADSRKDVSS